LNRLFLIENPFPQHKTAGWRTSWWWGWVWLTWQLAATEMENYCKTEGMKKHMPEGDQIMAPFFLPDCFRSLIQLWNSELKLHMASRTFSDLSGHLPSFICPFCGLRETLDCWTVSKSC